MWKAMTKRKSWRPLPLYDTPEQAPMSSPAPHGTLEGEVLSAAVAAARRSLVSSLITSVGTAPPTKGRGKQNHGVRVSGVGQRA